MKKNIDMVGGSLFPNIILYTIPIMLTGLLQLLFNAADLVVVGRYSGSIAVAAVSATGAITNLIVNLFMGLSVGAGVAVAHGMGSRNKDEVSKTVHTALPTALIGGVLLTIVGVFFSKNFLQWMQTPDNVLPYSTIYMQIYFAGITFSMVFNFCSSILCAAGDSKSPLIYLTMAGIINVILNLIFVVLFHMHVDGVALATTISQGIACFFVVRTLQKRNDSCKFRFRNMHVYITQLKKIIRIGLPAGIQGSLFSISNVIIQSSINSFNSELIMSGNGAASNIEGFVYTSMNSFQQTAINFIGQNTGAQRYDRVRKVFRFCLLDVTVVGLVAGLSVFTFRESLLSIYLADSPAAIAQGSIRFFYVCMPYFLCGLMDVATGALRGLGASLVPMIISVVGVCGFRIGWIYTIFRLPEYHTPQCLYISYPISWIITFICHVTAFEILYHKRQKAVKQYSLQ